MEKSQWYIGAENGIVLCIDQVEDSQTRGCFYHRYKEDATRFINTDQMIFQFEQLFDMMDFPHPGTVERTFWRTRRKTGKKQQYTVKMSDQEMLDRHGNLGTFIIRVQHRQNSSWQGRITWMEMDCTVYFRSVWEMVKLITSAVETGKESSGEENEKSFYTGHLDEHAVRGQGA